MHGARASARHEHAMHGHNNGYYKNFIVPNCIVLLSAYIIIITYSCTAMKVHIDPRHAAQTDHSLAACMYAQLTKS